MADVLALLGLDVLDKRQLIADTVCDRLIKKNAVSQDNTEMLAVENWSIPLARAGSHVHAEIAIPEQVCFSRQELHKLHRQFVHPFADKLYKLLRKARPKETKLKTLKVLENLSKHCDPCQRIQQTPTRFRVSIGTEDLKCNKDICMDIIYIENQPARHVVDIATNFSAEKFCQKLAQ